MVRMTKSSPCCDKERSARHRAQPGARRRCLNGLTYFCVHSPSSPGSGAKRRCGGAPCRHRFVASGSAVALSQDRRVRVCTRSAMHTRCGKWHSPRSSVRSSASGNRRTRLGVDMLTYFCAVRVCAPASCRCGARTGRPLAQRERRASSGLVWVAMVLRFALDACIRRASCRRRACGRYTWRELVLGLAMPEPGSQPWWTAAAAGRGLPTIRISGSRQISRPSTLWVSSRTLWRAPSSCGSSSSAAIQLQRAGLVAIILQHVAQLVQGIEMAGIERTTFCSDTRAAVSSPAACSMPARACQPSA